MKKKFIILVSIVGLIALTSLITLYQKNTTNQKTISSLSSKVDDLEDELKKAKDEISELEGKLAEVKHFDNDGTIGQGFSSSGLGGVSYTGDVLQTQIDGEFEGWEGETIFKLMNGTIWQQASYDYTYHYAYMPDVIIYKKDGIYYMKVEGVDDEIQVKQIR